MDLSLILWVYSARGPSGHLTPRKLKLGLRYNPSMEHSYEEVHQLAHSLPEEQRIQLANSLYESIDTEDEATGSESEVAAAWDAEIKRRLDEIDSGAVQMIPLEDVLADMDAHIASKRRG